MLHNEPSGVGSIGTNSLFTRPTVHLIQCRVSEQHSYREPLADQNIVPCESASITQFRMQLFVFRLHCKQFGTQLKVDHVATIAAVQLYTQTTTAGSSPDRQTETRVVTNRIAASQTGGSPP